MFKRQSKIPRHFRQINSVGAQYEKDAFTVWFMSVRCDVRRQSTRITHCSSHFQCVSHIHRNRHRVVRNGKWMLNRGSICFFFFTFFFLFRWKHFSSELSMCRTMHANEMFSLTTPSRAEEGEFLRYFGLLATCVCKLATNRLLFFLRCCFGGNSRCLSAAVKCFRCKQRELNLGKQTLEGTFWLTKYERWLSQSGR